MNNIGLIKKIFLRLKIKKNNKRNHIRAVFIFLKLKIFYVTKFEISKRAKSLIEILLRDVERIKSFFVGENGKILRIGEIQRRKFLSRTLRISHIKKKNELKSFF